MHACATSTGSKDVGRVGPGVTQRGDAGSRRRSACACNAVLFQQHCWQGAADQAGRRSSGAEDVLSTGQQASLCW
jgi:hypothetical protein